MKITPIDTNLFKLDGGAMFGVVPKRIWSRSYPADERNLCVWAMRCLLYEEGDRKILIDTGMGEKQDASFFSFYEPDRTHTLLSSLGECGCMPEDITDVVITHMHFDHVGGALMRVGNDLLPQFPNAAYWTNEAHLHHALNPNPRERASFLTENIQPLIDSDQLQMVPIIKGKEWQLTPHFSLRTYYGHTEAMMGAFIDYKGKMIVYLADLIPSAGHLRIPYVPSYDIRPLISMEEKERLLQEACANDYILFFEHDPFFQACTLRKEAKGIVSERKGDLADFL